MRQRRSAARWEVTVLALFALLLMTWSPALQAVQDEAPAPDSASEEQSPAPKPASAGQASAGAPADATAEAPAAGTGSEPILNKAMPLDLETLADKAARYPDNPYVLNEYGNQLMHGGRLNEAESVYKRVLEINPNFVQTWNNLALAYQAQRKFGKAKRAYKKALKLAPNYAIVHYNLGTAYEATGSYKKMIASYQRALELEPRLAQPEFNPQIGINTHLSAVLLQRYIDRGGSEFYPVLSVYPDGN